MRLRARLSAKSACQAEKDGSPAFSSAQCLSLIIDKIITALGLNPLINDTIKGGILLLAIGVQMLPEAFRKMRKNKSNRLIV